MNTGFKKFTITAVGSGFLAGAISTSTFAAQVFATDLIAQGSACIGFDCTSSESFGFDTLRLKENNLRIHADDTSSAGSFPNNDWRIIFNDSSNGGANKFSIEDTTGNKTPFTIEAEAPNNSLYVEDDGHVGIGNSNPVVNLHVTEGNSPTLRLEQDGSAGFTSQTWDLAGNETNFFLRDVTNGSKLPFRVKPGAPDDAIFIAASGKIGLGTDSPQKDLHVYKDSTDAIELQVENAGGGAAQVRIITSNANNRRLVGLSSNGIQESYIKLGDNELSFFGTDNSNALARMTTSGFEVGAAQINVPDYVFEDDYRLRPLQEVDAFIVANGHLPDVPSATTVNENGLNMTDMQMVLLRKVEELTLYTLQQQKLIDELLADRETALD